MYPRLAAATAALALAAGACATDVCEEGYEKQRECLESMSCTAMDPGLRAQCEQEKKRAAITYSQYKINQEAHGIDVTCQGEEQQKWEMINACNLEPRNLCGCR